MSQYTPDPGAPTPRSSTPMRPGEESFGHDGTSHADPGAPPRGATAEADRGPHAIPSLVFDSPPLADLPTASSIPSSASISLASYYQGAYDSRDVSAAYYSPSLRTSIRSPQPLPLSGGFPIRGAAEDADAAARSAAVATPRTANESRSFRRMQQQTPPPQRWDPTPVSATSFDPLVEGAYTTRDITSADLESPLGHSQRARRAVDSSSSSGSPRQPPPPQPPPAIVSPPSIGSSGGLARRATRDGGVRQHGRDGSSASAGTSDGDVGRMRHAQMASPMPSPKTFGRQLGLGPDDDDDDDGGPVAMLDQGGMPSGVESLGLQPGASTPSLLLQHGHHQLVDEPGMMTTTTTGAAMGGSAAVYLDDWGDDDDDVEVMLTSSTQRARQQLSTLYDPPPAAAGQGFEGGVEGGGGWGHGRAKASREASASHVEWDEVRASEDGGESGYASTSAAAAAWGRSATAAAAAAPGAKGETSAAAPRSSAEIYAAAGGDSPAVARARSGLERVGRSIRRVSRRVVDLDGEAVLGGRRGGAHVRLPPDGDASDDGDDEDETPVIVTEAHVAPQPHAATKTRRAGHSSSLRGRSLGIFGPESGLRRSVARALDNDWVEPAILLLIVLNVVVLVIQSAPSVYKRPDRPGYFDYWTDYALLAIYCIFTLEIAARIIVSGLIINPPPLEMVPTEELSPQGNVVELARGGAADEESDSSPPLKGGELAEPVATSPPTRPVGAGGHVHVRSSSRGNTAVAIAELTDSLRTRATRLFRDDDGTADFSVPPRPMVGYAGGGGGGGGVRRTSEATVTGGRDGFGAGVGGPRSDTAWSRPRPSRSASGDPLVDLDKRRPPTVMDELAVYEPPRHRSHYDEYKARRSLHPSRRSSEMLSGMAPGTTHRRDGSYGTVATAATAVGRLQGTSVQAGAGGTLTAASAAVDASPAQAILVPRRMREVVPFARALRAQREQTTHYAYLRHSWNRLDLLAVVGFWVDFGITLARVDSGARLHLFIFRALSVLRAARLLTLTSGTSTILESLKVASPLLFNVTFFIAFALLAFSIVGVQAFKGSYRRQCVWVGDLAPLPGTTPGTNYTLSQFCGGWTEPGTGRRLGALRPDGTPTDLAPKGFVCPAGQICVESDSNPKSGAQSFDNVFTSLLQVVIVISSNNWSPVMFNMLDSDWYASFIFFIAGIVLLNFWLANLLVAVITNTFAAISSETKQSAFAAEKIDVARAKRASGEEEEEEEEATATATARSAQRRRYRRKVANVYKRIWGFTRLFWLAAIVADLAAQATRASSQTRNELVATDVTELGFTMAFDVEILLRFFAFLLDDDWRGFVRSRHNRVDLALALVTSVIQVPAIKRSDVYPWLTIFQLARFYRVIAAVPRMEALLARVFGSMKGLFNMITFLLMMIGLAALIAVQLFRGDVPQQDASGSPIEQNFKHIYNSYLAMYQVFTSENWTDVLYTLITSEANYHQAVVAAIFICGWFLFANFIVLQMFIAVINENFSVAEGQKRAQQLELYLKRMEPPQKPFSDRILHQLSPYRWLRERNARMAKQVAEETSMEQRRRQGLGPDGAGMAQDGVDVRDALDEKGGGGPRARRPGMAELRHLVQRSRAHRFWHGLRRFLRLDRPEEQVPLDTVRARRFRQSLSGQSMLRGHVDPTTARPGSLFEASDRVVEARSAAAAADEASRLFARERRLQRMRSDMGLGSLGGGEEPVDQATINAQYLAQQKQVLEEDERMEQARLISLHPSYEKSLFLFSNTSSFRRFCQSVVPPSYGERIFGRAPSRLRRLVYQWTIFLAIAASVIVAAVATPGYRKGYYLRHGVTRNSWFTLTEVLLSVFFFVEFLLKVIADGFAFTPNAYLLSGWNALDLFVVASLLVNVISELVVPGGVSRFTRSLKAFRALRLINSSDFMRRTFITVLAGTGRFIDASILAILYIVPYAIWGQNLFSGMLRSCNDGSSTINTRLDCHGEYSSSPSQWNFLAPRVWQNPTQGSSYSFDDFRSALLILFEIVSLEGWIDVMKASMSVVGFDQQLQPDSRQVNALFFLIYNLIGAVFVLTLFVSVIIESTRLHSGAAFLTTEQLQWNDLKRLISRQRPSKRPKVRPRNAVRAWCYERAVRKHGWWSKAMTCLYVANTFLLASTTYQASEVRDLGLSTPRDIAYICFASCYAVDLGVRLTGLGVRNLGLWDAYDLVVVAGVLSTTIPVTVGARTPAVVQFQEVFLTLVVLKLIQKSNALHQLFRTAVASLPSVGSLFLLWLVAFLVWGLAFLEVFGTTRWGNSETWQINFASLPASLLFLAMCSTGEGWNNYMHDFVGNVSPYCTPSSNYLETDCSSAGWAYFLFISWNILSMYLFLNLFTGTVVENFSYLFQGSKPLLGREQLRAFKKAWSQFDPHRTGYLPPEQLVPFLRSVRGVLDVRIYPDAARVSVLRRLASVGGGTSPPPSPSTPTRAGAALARLRGTSPAAREGGGGVGHAEDSERLLPRRPSAASAASALLQADQARGSRAGARVVAGLDLSILEEALSRLDKTAVRARRKRFDRIVMEAKLRAVPEKGVGFNQLLEILAHYKLVDDELALGLDELVERRALLERVEDRLEMERVRGLLHQMWLRRRYVALKEERRRASVSPQASLSATEEEYDGYGGRRLAAPRGPQEPGNATLSKATEAKEGEVQRPMLSLDMRSLHRGRSGSATMAPGVSLAGATARPGPARHDPSLFAGSSTTLPSSVELGVPVPALTVSASEDDLGLGGGGGAGASGSGGGGGAAAAFVGTPSIEELEMRISPSLETFNQSAWGGVARRLSRKHQPPVSSVNPDGAPRRDGGEGADGFTMA